MKDQPQDATTPEAREVPSPTEPKAPRGHRKSDSTLVQRRVNHDRIIWIRDQAYQLPETSAGWEGKPVAVRYWENDPSVIVAVLGGKDLWVPNVDAKALSAKSERLLVDVRNPMALSMIKTMALSGLLDVVDPGSGKAEVPEEHLPTCPICGHQTTVLRFHAALAKDACLVCYQTAELIENRFMRASTKHRNEFLGQLEQMVKDVRSGASTPTFYRGFE